MKQAQNLLAASFLVSLLTGCGPSFTPDLLTKCGEMMLPDSMGAGGVNPPLVGGAPNSSRDRHWSGKILLVTAPLNASQNARVHPAMAKLDPALQAANDQEVTAVGYVIEFRKRNGGFMSLSILDWKSKVHLGDWTLASWKDKEPERADFEANYPTLLATVRKLHR